MENSVKDTNLNQMINDHLSNLPKKGDIVKGGVLHAHKKEILIDIDGFTTGVIRGPEIKNLPHEYLSIKPGTEVEAMVIDIENEKGQMELSLKAAAEETAWQFIKDKEKNQEVLEVRISGANKGGLLANISSMPAFCLSHS
jgi:small subunit ribosomal protein S1